ncbi:MAG: inorganic phosphate transporter [Verrucomicrobia bacterium]|nr:inorganic phosphate transporter [Verrucomicrobiota bacterium]
MDLFLVFAVLFVALAFTYTNGFHDTANAIATVVGTKVLTPRQAILLAAVTNLFGAFFGLAVAKTISSGLVDARFVTQEVLICGLLAAIFWNLLTWWFGLPSSSSHALVGSLVGAALAGAVCMNAVTPLIGKDGKPGSVWSAIKWEEVKDKKEKKLVPASAEVVAALGERVKTNGTHTVSIGTNKFQAVVFAGRVGTVEVVEKKNGDKGGLYYKVVIPMVTSPLMGFFGGMTFMALLYTLLRNWRPVTVNRLFGKLQLASSAYMGFSHGMNDATKCMGIITLALVAATSKGLFSNVPDWASFLVTKEGSNPLALSLGDHLVAMLPSFLHFGYMPNPADIKSQGIPNWVVVLCALTMAAGTAAGGWRIIRTLGHRMVKLQPVHGFAAETTAATVLAVAASLGMPISTTHAITTSIMGVGCAKRFSALKLKVVERIIWAWIMTLPATAGVAFGLVWLMSKVGFVKF